MSLWFRYYNEALDDPKVQKLHASLFKTWVNILSLASKHDGIIPAIEEVAFRLRMSDHDAQAHIDELIGLGLLDIRADRRVEPHNWMKRQFVSDTSTRRVRKFRKLHKKPAGNVSETVGETAPDTDTDTDSETEQNRSPLAGGVGDQKFRRKRRQSVDDVFKRMGVADET